MRIRCGLLATLASALLALYHGSPWLDTPQLQCLLATSLFGLAGGAIARRTRRLAVWQVFWLVVTVGVWVAVTSPWLVFRLEPLAGFPGVALAAARPYAISTTLLFGGALLLARAITAGKSTALPLLMLNPLWIALLAALNPAGEGMAWLPLLAAAGCPLDLPTAQEPPDDARWQVGPAELVEMSSLQCVAWGLLLAILSLSLELSRGDWLSALILSSGSGVTAWLMSGLLWGLAEALRQGRIPATRLARFVFGPAAV